VILINGDTGGAEIVTEGAVVYPNPGLSITIDDNWYVIELRIAYPVAVLTEIVLPKGGAGGAENVTIGSAVYPEP
jgi:hypothetical protein